MDTRWPSEIYDYIESKTRFDDPVLTEMEARAKEQRFPIISPLVGPLLYMFARMINAKRVYELGSGFGYSTWYFARAIEDNGGGVVTHTVWDEGLSKDAKGYLEKANLMRYCDFQVSESVLALTSAEPGIDLIFMDIDKEGYPGALEVIEQKLRPGGVLLIDNMLWSGKILDESDQSEATVGIRKVTQMLSDSERWEFSIIPLRDGISIAWFKG